MDLRYGVRRLSSALLATTTVAVLLALFLFPVTVVKDLSVGSRPAGVITCFTGTEFISFRPIWQLEGHPPDGTGLVLQTLIVLSLGIGVWATYPAFKPSR